MATSIDLGRVKGAAHLVQALSHAQTLSGVASGPFNDWLAQALAQRTLQAKDL